MNRAHNYHRVDEACHMPGVAGRVALVTGAGNPDGIGFATARALSAAGAKVMMAATTDRITSRVAELTAATADKGSWVGDLSDPGQANSLVAAVLARFGKLDIVINNAGMAQTGATQPWSLIEDIDDDEWRSANRLSLDTCFFVTRAAVPGMKRQGFGRIVNMSSVSGPVVTFPRGGAYGAAKAGMVGLTRSLALELGAFGITANAIAPGWIANGKGTPQITEAGKRTPVGRPGRPEEVASLALYLASEESSYLTGQMIVVDGGNTIQEVKG